jgi:hypothetical protein
MQGTSRLSTKMPPVPEWAERPGFDFIAGAHRASIDARSASGGRTMGARGGGNRQLATGNQIFRPVAAEMPGGAPPHRIRAGKDPMFV